MTEVEVLCSPSRCGFAIAESAAVDPVAVQQRLSEETRRAQPFEDGETRCRTPQVEEDAWESCQLQEQKCWGGGGGG